MTLPNPWLGGWIRLPKCVFSLGAVRRTLTAYRAGPVTLSRNFDASLLLFILIPY